MCRLMLALLLAAIATFAVAAPMTKEGHVNTVFLDGDRLDGEALRKASGLNGMPK